MRWLTRHAKILLAAYGVFLFLALLSPVSNLQSEAVAWLGRLLGDLGMPASLTIQPRLEFIMNAVIIAPVPFLGYLLLPRYSWRDWTALGFVGALTIEFLQGLLLPDRTATYVDVVANTLGALLGAGLAELSRTSGPQLRVSPRARRGLRVAYGAYLLVVAVLVLDPTQRAPGASLSLVSRVLTALQLPVAVDSRALEVLSNVALFVPFGLLGVLLWPSHRLLTWASYGALVSGLIELSQLALLPERFATLLDVVANTAGALFGAILASVTARVLMRRQRPAPTPEVQVSD